MKRLFYLLLVFGSSTAIGQNSKVVSAFNAKEAGEFAKAREYIDDAVVNEKTQDDDKAWRYRGEIYQRIALSEEDFGVDKKTAIGEALRSYQKAKELDVKKRNTDLTMVGYNQTRNLAINKGIEAYNAKDYANSRDFFKMGAEAGAELGVFDTLAVYNAGLAAEQAGDNETALEMYRKAMEAKYLGAKMYVYMANIYQKEENDDQYIAIIQEGRKAYPDDADLIVYELNHYLKNDKFEEAENNLKLAIAKEPENKQLQFSLGVVYDQLKRTEDAVKAYSEAIKIDSEYFDAQYNLGAMYFNKGVEMNNSANDIKDNKKYDAARAEAKAIFIKSKPYLEKAHELDPTDVGAMASLKQLYALLDNQAKYDEMKAKLEAVEK